MRPSRVDERGPIAEFLAKKQAELARLSVVGRVPTLANPGKASCCCWRPLFRRSVSGLVRDLLLTQSSNPYLGISAEGGISES